MYAALLRLGPTSGYAVARSAGLARANAYGALEGLVTRGAATKDPGRPARYRPADPQALVARLATDHGEALDRLSRELEHATQSLQPDTRTVEGTRAIANLTLQLVARAETRISGIVAGDLFQLTLPAWRRAAQRATLDVRVAGSAPPEAEQFISGTLSPDAPTVLLIDDAQTVVAIGPLGQRNGIWSSHPAVVALARAAVTGLQ